MTPRKAQTLFAMNNVVRRWLLRTTALGLWCIVGTGFAPGADAETLLRAGDPAPVLTFQDCRGTARIIDWSARTPAATIIFFFDPQSPASLLEMTFLDALHERARDFGLAVFAVETAGRDSAGVGRSLQRYCALYRDPSFALVPDADYRLGGLFRVREAPTTFLVEQNGTIAAVREGFDEATAVDLTRTAEMLLHRPQDFFSFALRALGVSEDAERTLATRRAVAEREKPAAEKMATVGDRLPPLAITDLAGRVSRWEWPSPGSTVRVILFWSGLTPTGVEEMAYLDRIHHQAGGTALEIIAVEAGGLDPTGIRGFLENYRSLHPLPSYPIIPDPGGLLAGIFGIGGRTPQIYLVGPEGTVLYHGGGLSSDETATLAGKIERSLQVAGNIPPNLQSATGSSPAPAGSGEAPSVRQREERRATLNLNLSLGDYFFYNRDWERAALYYQRVMALDPTQVSVLVRTAQICEQRGDAVEELATWERVLSLQPENPQARARIGKLRP